MLPAASSRPPLSSSLLQQQNENNCRRSLKQNVDKISRNVDTSAAFAQVSIAKTKCLIFGQYSVLHCTQQTTPVMNCNCVDQSDCKTEYPANIKPAANQLRAIIGRMLTPSGIFLNINLKM